MNLKQRTLKQETIFKGIGLHTGNLTTAKFIPAPPNTGVHFVRTDLPGKPSIPASIENVTGVIRGTTIEKNGGIVHTVEHICSALYGLGIDNLIIEVDANEPPVADGSSLPFFETLEKAGIEEQEAPKNIFTVTEPIVYQSNETVIKLESGPSELTIHGQLLFDHPMIGNQEAAFTLNSDIFKKEIAGARTFCFDYEVEALKRKGLARGGSLDSAVVIGADQIYNKEKTLRFPNEFVRHKILDFIGDLFLFGRPVIGKITAIKIGHGHNINFVKDLVRYANSNAGYALR